MTVSHQQWGQYESEFIYFDDRETERERERESYISANWLAWLADVVPRGSFEDKACIYLFIYFHNSINYGCDYYFILFY